MRRAPQSRDARQLPAGVERICRGGWGIGVFGGMAATEVIEGNGSQRRVIEGTGSVIYGRWCHRGGSSTAERGTTPPTLCRR